jgi:hypothetical protein
MERDKASFGFTGLQDTRKEASLSGVLARQSFP